MISGFKKWGIMSPSPHIIIAFLLVSFCSAQFLNAEKSVVEDENLQKQIMIFRKLRALLGPTSLLSNAHSAHNHNRSIPEAREEKKKKKGEETNNRRVLIALLVSAGITSSLCAVGILWGCQRFRKTRKNLVTTLLLHCTESVEKVQLSETTFLKQDVETATAISNQTTSEKSEEEEQQLGTGEIISVHHSSDDESFHSICNSFSPDNIRFSNASATSLCEASEIISQHDSNFQTSLPLTIINPKLPPPPPPPLLTNSVKASPLGKQGTLLPKLKPLHWDKVKALPQCSTVWDKLKASSFEFDEEMIESLFGYNLQNPLKNDEAKTKSPSPSPSKHILEPKRIQNITILSKALNATSEQVCQALLNGSGLCLQELEALVKMAPAKEEETKLLNYKGDVNELASAERFVKAMLKVPSAFTRIEAMLFKETFDDEVFLLRTSFSAVEEACKELRSSQLFLKLLEAVLKTGNRMNNGTVRGGAKAFKLDALLKLSDIKGTDGKTTLLHFVVQEMVRSEGSRNTQHYTSMQMYADLSTELCNVKQTAALDLDVLTSCVSNLAGGIAKIQNLVCKAGDGSSKFVQSMQGFLNYAERSLKEVQEDEQSVVFRVREITEYFHGDVGRDESNPLRIFVIVRDFLGMLDRVCKEIISSSRATTSTN